MYAYSALICLPDGLAHPDSAWTGTVLRRPLLERYARAAGFTGVEMLPGGDLGFLRAYRLHQEVTDGDAADAGRPTVPSADLPG